MFRIGAAPVISSSTCNLLVHYFFQLLLFSEIHDDFI